MDSETGVGRNWSRDSAASCVKVWRNACERAWHFSRLILIGCRKSCSRSDLSGVEPIAADNEVMAAMRTMSKDLSHSWDQALEAKGSG